MGQKAVLHTLRVGFSMLLLVAFWLAPSVVSAKNNTEHEKNSASAISITFTVTHVSCAGGNNGAITATASGGQGPYTFHWNTGPNTATISNLTANYYYVTVTDATSATATGFAEVQQPLAVGAGAAQVQGQICQFSPNGIALAYAWGGTAPYTYVWSNGATGDHAFNLAFGNYQVTATDSHGCTAKSSIDIQNNTAEGIWIQVNNDLVCVGQLGTLHASAMSGTPPYNYHWSTGATTQDITGLTPGNYTVTIGDASGCSGIKTAQVNLLPAVTLSGSATNASCNSTGSATVVPGGGSGTGYVVSWSNGQFGNSIFGLAAGSYTATVTDSEGCSATTTVTVQGGGTVNVSATPNSAATCLTGGSATATASGGSGTITFLWDNGQTTATATGLSAGTHIVTAMDAAGCKGTAVVTIAGPSGGPSVTVTVNANAGCTTGGSATATATGGAGGYTYLWDNGQTTQTATNLSAGNHTPTVTDAAGCKATAVVNIQQTSGPTLSAQTISNATCTTGGSASVNAFGGTPPYTYTWDNLQTTQTATNLTAGVHTVTVTDFGGCTATAQVNVQGPTGLPMVTVSVIAPATCAGGGAAMAMAMGGAGGYKYLWDNGQTTATATNLAGGSHSVTVTDSNSCTVTGSVNVPTPTLPQLSITIVSQAMCNLGGSATASATGGVAPYTFKWDNLQTTATATNLSAGVHNVSATDANGCVGVGTVTIISTSGSMVVTALVNSNAICNVGGSATATASGGSAPYSYKWSNGQLTAVLSNVASGSYTVTATDANGCTATKTVTIATAPGAKIGDFVWYDVSQNGFQDAAETTGVSGVNVKVKTAGPDGNFGTADDVTVLTTTTDALGYYLFDCVPPGTYVICFSEIPSGYQFTKKNYVNNDCKDSDAAANGCTDPFTVVANQADDLCFDAGIHTICNNVTSPGSICCDQMICEGATPALLVNNLTPFGGSGTIEYQWLQLVQQGPAPATWVGIPGATNANYQPGPLYQTSYFMRCARRAGCVAYLESNIVTVTVKPAGSPGCPTPFIAVAGTLLNSTVAVSWTAIPEHSDLTYVVEHSTDKTNWTAIATLPGLGATDHNNSYEIMDNAPLVGSNFYHVLRVNRDGESVSSDIVEVGMFMNKLETVKFWPIPATNELNVQNLMTYDQPVTIEFFDPTGKILREFTLPKQTITKKVIDLSTYPTGLFFARVRFGKDEVRVVKLTKFGE